MQIKKYKPYGRWIYGEYDFYIGNHIVANLRRQFLGYDYVYVYFLPQIHSDSYRIRINIKDMINREVIEKATQIIQSKLYTLATDILSDIKHTEIE